MFSHFAMMSVLTTSLEHSSTQSINTTCWRQHSSKFISSRKFIIKSSSLEVNKVVNLEQTCDKQRWQIVIRGQWMGSCAICYCCTSRLAL